MYWQTGFIAGNIPSTVLCSSPIISSDGIMKCHNFPCIWSGQIKINVCLFVTSNSSFHWCSICWISAAVASFWTQKGEIMMRDDGRGVSRNENCKNETGGNIEDKCEIRNPGPRLPQNTRRDSVTSFKHASFLTAFATETRQEA